MPIAARCWAGVGPEGGESEGEVGSEEEEEEEKR